MQKNTIRKGFEGADKVDLSITCTGKVSSTVKATFEAAPELLDAYNQANNSSYVVPPTSAYSIEDANVAITPGNFVSSQARLMIGDPTQFEEGKNYCLPFEIAFIHGEPVDALEDEVHIITRAYEFVSHVCPQ